MSTSVIVVIVAITLAVCAWLAYRVLSAFAFRLVALHDNERAEWHRERGELKTENADLKRQLINLQDKVETLLGEIGDMQKKLGFEQGIGAADEIKAEAKKRVERIESTPLEPTESEPEPKRGRNGRR